MDSLAASGAGTACEAMLLQTVLEPLFSDERSLGAYGAACISQSIARADRHGFAALVAASLERRDA